MVKMVDDFLVISYRAVWSGGGGSLVDLFLLAMRTASEPCVVFIFWFLFVWLLEVNFGGHPVGEMRYLRHFNGQSLGCFCYEGSRQELCIFSHCETWHMPNWNIQKQQGWMCVSLSDRLLHTWTHHLQSTANCVISLSKHHLETVFPHFDWTTKQFLAWVLPWFEVALMGPTSEVIPPHGTNAVDDAPDTDSDCVMPKDK